MRRERKLKVVRDIRDTHGRYSRSALIGEQTYVKASERQIIDRDRRRELVPRDLTASLMGDPLPGLSALDRRR